MNRAGSSLGDTANSCPLEHANNHHGAWGGPVGRAAVGSRGVHSVMTRCLCGWLNPSFQIRIRREAYCPCQHLKAGKNQRMWHEHDLGYLKTHMRSACLLGIDSLLPNPLTLVEGDGMWGGCNWILRSAQLRGGFLRPFQLQITMTAVSSLTI